MENKECWKLTKISETVRKTTGKRKYRGQAKTTLPMLPWPFFSRFRFAIILLFFPPQSTIMPGKKDKKKRQEVEPEPLKPDDVEYDKESLKVKIATYEMKIIRLRRENIELADKVERLEKEMTDVKGQSYETFQRLTKKLDILEKESVKMKYEAVQNEEDKARVESDLRNQMNQDQEEMNGSKQELISEIAELKTKLEEVAQFRRDKDSMVTNINELESSIQQNKITHSQELDKLHDIHKEEREQLREDTIKKWRKTRLEVYKLTEDHLQTKTQQTIQENEKLTRDLDVYAREAREMIRHNSKLIDDNTSTKRSLEIEQRSVSELMEKSQQQQRAIRNLVQKLKSYEELYKQGQQDRDTEKNQRIISMGETIDSQYDIILDLKKQLDEESFASRSCQKQLDAVKHESVMKTHSITDAQQFLLRCFEDVKQQGTLTGRGRSLTELKEPDRLLAIEYIRRKFDGFESGFCPKPPPADDFQTPIRPQIAARSPAIKKVHPDCTLPESLPNII